MSLSAVAAITWDFPQLAEVQERLSARLLLQSSSPFALLMVLTLVPQMESGKCFGLEQQRHALSKL